MGSSDVTSAQLQQFGSRMRTLRNRRQMSLHALHERAGVSVKRIGDIEKGRRPVPKHQILISLGKALGVRDETILDSLRTNTELDVISDAEWRALQREHENAELAYTEEDVRRRIRFQDALRRLGVEVEAEDVSIHRPPSGGKGLVLRDDLIDHIVQQVNARPD